MAKLFKAQGFSTVIRIDRINAVDKIKNEDGEIVVRVFLAGADSRYEMNFLKYDDAAGKAYEDIVKAMEED